MGQLAVLHSGPFLLSCRRTSTFLWPSIRPVSYKYQIFTPGSNYAKHDFNTKTLRRQRQCSTLPSSRKICAAIRKNGNQGLLSENGEPFWLSLVKDIAWSLRSLATFLAEQPSQLKYIEWPTFKSTLKTATLTLVLVALLIVALSSIDSALSYILAFLLRRAA